MIKMIHFVCLFLVAINCQSQAKVSMIIGTTDTKLSLTLSRVLQNGLLNVADTINKGAGKTFKHKITIENQPLHNLELKK